MDTVSPGAYTELTTGVLLINISIKPLPVLGSEP